MNWLAHLRLAPRAPLVRLGNLAGDFVRGVELRDLHPELRRGIEQHRAIDRFVDAHPVCRRGRGRFAPPWRRFAGVALDVFYDHYLARDWSRHGGSDPLDDFVEGVHEELARHRALLPPDLRRIHAQMRRHGWLRRYGTVEGVEGVLVAMSQRSPRAHPLATAASELRRHYDTFEADFVELWPELTAFAARSDDGSAQSLDLREQ